MIEIGGRVQRSFIFPADRATAFAYYADLSRTFGCLPHIRLVRQHESQTSEVLETSEV